MTLDELLIVIYNYLVQECKILVSIRQLIEKSFKCIIYFYQI